MSMVEDYTIQCDRCGKIAGWQPTKRLAQEAAKATGWLPQRNIVGGKTYVCPDCQRSSEQQAADMLSVGPGPTIDEKGRMMWGGHDVVESMRYNLPLSEQATPYTALAVTLDGIADADERQQVREYIKQLESERAELRAALVLAQKQLAYYKAMVVAVPEYIKDEANVSIAEWYAEYLGGKQP